MKKFLFLVASFLICTQVANSQQYVAPIGKNQTNFQSPANPQCNELDIGGLTYSVSNPIPVQASQANSAVSVSNPLYTQLSNGSASMAGLAPKGAVNLPFMQGSSTLPTYMATTGFSSLVATATDFVGIVGSATKTVKIHQIYINTYQSTAGLNEIFGVVRSTADTGSTIVNPTIVPMDSANSVATAVINQYTTTNPTTGSLVGNVFSTLVYAPILATGTSNGRILIFDEKSTGQPIVLRGVAQEFDLNFAGTAVPSGFKYSVDVLFSEE